MSRPVIGTATLVAVALMTLACGGGGEPGGLKELHRVRAANLDIVLLSPRDAVRQGKDTFVVEFRAADDDTLVDVGDVKASATMPMAGMPPMFGSVDVLPGGAPGRYSVTSDLTMAGDWRIGLEWSGPAGRGSATISTSAQ